MTFTLKGLTKDLLKDLVQLGLDNYAAQGAVVNGAGRSGPAYDPAWTPLAMIADDGVTGFIAYVDDGDGRGHYVIMLTVDASEPEPDCSSATIEDLFRRLVAHSGQELALAA
jgi:hypothetical protein